MPAQTTIKVRRDTAANWTTTNPTLSAGEFGYETDTGKLKIGSGTSTWTALGYTATQGTTGATGSQGTNGIQGTQGLQGTNGTQGLQGTSYTSVVTAKGDLIVATGSGTVTNQAIGVQYQTLVPDTSQTDGLRWGDDNNLLVIMGAYL